MFNLEQEVLEWRQQMLTAGIRSLPLDELEQHLREEIEHHRRAGHSEVEAFAMAVQKIGSASALKNEFKKVDAGRFARFFRATGLAAGWLAAGWFLACGVHGLEFLWNFGNFSIQWNGYVGVSLLYLSVAQISFWFLAKARRHWTVGIVAFVVCSSLMVDAFSLLPPEPLGGHIWVRYTPSPWWFRDGCALWLTVPGFFFAWRQWQMRKQPENPVHTN